MPRIIAKTALLLIVSSLCAGAQVRPGANAKGAPQKVPATRPGTPPQSPAIAQPVPAPVQATPAPRTLAQQPAVNPRVTYANGLLSIDAPNSNLSDILNGIRRATGAAIEGNIASGDRVVVRLGPGQPQEVISALLNGSRFDYIVLGSQQRPGAIDRLVLLARSSAPATNVGGSVNAAPPAGQPNRVPPAANTDGMDEEEDDMADRDIPDEPEYQPGTEELPQEPAAQGQPAPGAPGQPGQPQPVPPGTAVAPNQQQPGQVVQPAQGQAAQPDATNQNQNQNQPKTPEQLFRELQELQRRSGQEPGQQNPQ